MIRYVLYRILMLIPIIICVSFIIFALMDLTPGTVVDSMINENMTPEDIAALREKYDVDRPMLFRYGKYMFRLVQGDLGISQITQINIWDTYISRFPNTVVLALASLLIGSTLSIPLGIRAARHAGTISDNLTTAFTIAGMSMPSFWMGLLLLLLFSYRLQWLPAGGNKDGIRSLLLPAICSGVNLLAIATRQTRSSMLEVLNSDYLRTARAKGVPEKDVIRRHALSNAWIPIITTFGGSLGITIAGSAVIETVFAWPGVGRMVVESVTARDVNMTCGCVIMTSILYALIQLIVDVLYAFVDPRIKARYTSSRKRRKRKTATTSIGGRPDVPFRETVTEESIAQDRQAASALIAPALIKAGESASLSAENDSVKEEYVTKKEDIYSERAATNKKNDNAILERKADPYFLVSKQYRKRNRFGEIMHSLMQNKGATAGLIIAIIVFLIMIYSMIFISFEDVTASDISFRLAPPSWQHPFGCDDMGRDVLLRTLYGSRYSLAIGFGAVGIATVIGVFLGSIAGFFGKIVETLIMRFSDVMSSIPGILLGMVIVTVLGLSLGNLILAVGISIIPGFIRISRASILTVRDKEFVEAARAIGLSNVRIIFAQVLPNGLSPILVTFTASLGTSIIIAAALSFMGFGVPLPRPEWGTLVSSGRNYIRASPHLMMFPGLFIMITVLAFNLLGDGLRDALDPKLKK